MVDFSHDLNGGGNALLQLEETDTGNFFASDQASGITTPDPQTGAGDYFYNFYIDIRFLKTV